MENIYEFIVSHGLLSDAHRDDLKSKRGFSDDTIASGRFFSGGKYLLEFEDELIRSFEKDDLIRSGVVIVAENSEKPTLSSQLLENRIIIPYLTKQNKAYFIRPHKMGLTNVGIQIYHEKSLEVGDKPHLILAESEFKAAAAMQLGFKAIGIPGVGSFSDTNYKKFIDFLQSGKIKQVCILFDNEIKGDPAFPNYKEKPINRYDTEYYSYLMCKQLFNDGIDARIGRLPDQWRMYGKVDIDSALAAGHTKDEFNWIVSNSKTFKGFYDDLKKEAKDIVFKKLQKKYFRSDIHIDFNKYVATRHYGKREWDEEISNFIIKIMATHETPDGVVREAVLIDGQGKHSRSFALDSKTMMKNDEFRIICNSMGNFVWKGRMDDLLCIWEEQFFDDDGRVIVEPDHIGHIKKEKIFLCSNVAIHLETAEEFRPDKDGIFWLGDRGYKPSPIVVTTGKGEISEGIPYMNISPIDKNEIKLKFEETIGKYETMIMLGWVAAFVFMEDIFELYGCYPFLFVTGRRGSGKSTVAEWITKLFGLEGSGRMISDTTTVAIQRLMGYYSCLPVYLDEFRNSKQIAPRMGMLRNVYNRQSAGKGIKENFGIREGKVRGGLILSGEETPEDNALLTRCVVIAVSAINRKVNHYNWFQANKGKFSNFFYELLKKRPALKKAFIDDLHAGKEFFVKKGLDDRIAIHYSIIGCGYGAAFGEIPQDFMDYLAVETVRIKEDYEREQAVSVFWDDILAFQSSGLLNKGLWICEDGMIYIYFHALYIAWAQEFRKIRGTEPFKSSAIRDYLKEEPGFVKLDHVKQINDSLRRCVVFDKDKAPAQLQELISNRTDRVPENQ